MNKEIILKVRVDNVKDAKFVFDKLDEVADLVGADKIEMEMRNREGLLSMFRGLWGWIIR